MYDVFPILPVLNRACSAFSRGKSLVLACALTVLSVLLAPAFAEAQMTALESVPVRTGEAVRLKMPLEAGELFLLKASGTVQVGTSRVDAEGSGSGAAKPSQDGVAVTDIGSDGTVSAQNTPVQNTPAQSSPVQAALKRRRWLGSSRSNHTYYMIVSGAGKPPAFHLLTSRPQTGTNAITISVFRLSPAPIPLPLPLETVQVPVQERGVATSLVAQSGTLYLLQASGFGKVGGGGLGQGDAEYMDYNADGKGAVDIGDANTDYGLGVDEANQNISPRLHKWGAWRKDHTYYLLFAGTGLPIHFFFYDVKGGYGDNSPTDALTVKVFPIP